MKLLIEAVVVGVFMILFGYIGSIIAKNLLPKTENYENFNKYHVMELALFLAGFLAHLSFQLLGVNKWYCKYGVACTK